MRKDGKSQYQVKKDKLLRIKELMTEQSESVKKVKNAKTTKEIYLYANKMITIQKVYAEIWEIVKDE